MRSKVKSLIRMGLAVFTVVVVSECIRETATSTPAPERPRTGVLLKKAAGQKGKLRIKNKSNLDLVVALTLADEPQEALRVVYVRAGEMYMTTGIKGGVYRCYFAFGEDWDGDSKRFTRNAYYYRFKDLFKFTRQRRKYSVWTGTFSGPGYFANAENVTESEFPYGDRKGREPKFPRGPELSYRVMFTTGLTNNNQPVNNLKEISINEQRIYIYVSWFSISDGEHNYLCKIFDGSGQLVTTSQMSFTSEGGSHDTWTWHNINKYVDKPGSWTFEIYLDSKKVIKENLVVLSQ